MKMYRTTHPGKNHGWAMPTLEIPIYRDLKTFTHNTTATAVAATATTTVLATTTTTTNSLSVKVVSWCQ